MRAAAQEWTTAAHPALAGNAGSSMQARDTAARVVPIA